MTGIFLNLHGNVMVKPALWFNPYELKSFGRWEHLVFARFLQLEYVSCFGMSHFTTTAFRIRNSEEPLLSVVKPFVRTGTQIVITTLGFCSAVKQIKLDFDFDIEYRFSEIYY